MCVFMQIINVCRVKIIVYKFPGFFIFFICGITIIILILARVVTLCNELELFDVSGCHNLTDKTIDTTLTSVKIRTNNTPLQLIVGGQCRTTKQKDALGAESCKYFILCSFSGQQNLIQFSFVGSDKSKTFHVDYEYCCMM